MFTVVPITVNFDEVGLPDIDEPFGKDFADWIVRPPFDSCSCHAMFSPTRYPHES